MRFMSMCGRSGRIQIWTVAFILFCYGILVIFLFWMVHFMKEYEFVRRALKI